MEINGRDIADAILQDLRLRVLALKTKNIVPRLAVILVGTDPASKIYVSQKQRHGENIQTQVDVLTFSQDVTESELIDTIRQLNADTNIHGIIVQRPLPKQINPDVLEEEIEKSKDVDGFKPESPFYVPVVLSVLEILERIKTLEKKAAVPLQEWLRTKKIVLIGKGSTAGKPLSDYFSEVGIKTLLIDSQTKDPKDLTKTADIIISSVGKQNIITPIMIKKGVILISVGISKDEMGKLHGDYENADIAPLAAYYTPTPRGVGPINVSELLSNLVTAAENA